MTGNIWKFSDQLDIEDLEFGRGDFITYKLGVEYYGLSPKVFTKLAWESGAVYKLNKKVLIKREILEEHLRNLMRKGEFDYGDEEEE